LPRVLRQKGENAYAARSQAIKIDSQEERQAIYGMGEESVKGISEVDHTKTALENMGFESGGNAATDKLLERLPSLGQTAESGGSSLNERTPETAQPDADVGRADLSRARMESLTMGAGSDLKADYAAKKQETRIDTQK
jgi:hypothetical protein